jgi:hypothetical protein
MAGAHSAIAGRGARSEILAEYLFSAWGPVVRGRWEFDYGVDLFCAFADTVGQRAWVANNYTVQVKSNRDTWLLESAEEVRWQVEYPSPFFVCIVDKARGEISIYQTMSRFHAGARGQLPDQLQIIPGDGASGTVDSSAYNGRMDLSAPIVRIASAELFDTARIDELKSVLRWWVNREQENLRLFANGFRVAPTPSSYITNEIPQARIEIQPALAESEKVAVASVLRETLNRLGPRLLSSGDLVGVVYTALFYRWLDKLSPDISTDYRIFGMLLPENRPVGSVMTRPMTFAEIDELSAAVEKHQSAGTLMARLARKATRMGIHLREEVAALLGGDTSPDSTVEKKTS